MRGRLFFWVVIVILFCIFFHQESRWRAKVYTKNLIGRSDADDYTDVYQREKERISREWAEQFEILLNKSSPVSKWELMALIRNEFGASNVSNGHYVCNPEVLAHQWHACLMYSVGIVDSPNFETDFQNYTDNRCWTVLIDEDPVDTTLARTWTLRKRIEKFSKSDQNISSLIDVLQQYQHSIVDILKLDIDGNMIPIIHSTISLFEVHHILTTVTAKPRELAKFLSMMTRLGYVLYAWEMDLRKPNTLIASHVHDQKVKTLGFGQRQGMYFYHSDFSNSHEFK
uniref:Methyltranfer_dom domain-containing protein n=1 Tax=Steinernema glaseri TaxID=37863 RepID=A0A1I8ABZ2_9BILA